MPTSSLSNVCIMIITIIILFYQCICTIQAGNCFYQRTNDLCYDLSEANTNEEQCTGSYYSDDSLQELDGYVYAEKCRDVNVTPTRCDVKCDLGEECQWIDEQEMCVCSESSCVSANLSSSNSSDQSVCASNNMSFSSECAMEAWKCFNQRSALYKKYDGECQKDCRNVKCPHGTVCLLVKNTGEPICYPKRHCNPDLDPEPVCGTNGITYSNICAMRLSRDRRGRTPELAHKGPCERECRPDLCQSNELCVYSKRFYPTCIRCNFTPTFFRDSGECSMNIPVCGDDGNLYENYCSLLVAQCDTNQYINIVDYGTCPTIKRKNINTKKIKYLNRLSNSRMN